MNKKFSLGVTISLVAIGCAITFVITMFTSLNTFNAKIAGVSEREEIYTKIHEIDTYVRNNSIYKLDEEALKASIVNGYITGIDDSAAQYLTADEYYRKQQIESGTYVSAGIDAAKEESGYIKVTAVYAGSSAASTEITVGDIITSIGGSNVLEIGADAALKMIDGEENTKLDLVVQRSGIEIPISLTRLSFTVKAVSSDIYNKIGYIRINVFNKQTAAQFDAAVENLLAQNAEGIVIDVRNCTGLYEPLSQTLTHFISSGHLADAKYADETIKKLLETTGTADMALPMTVLVDENTKGAAELFAVSLRDFASAKLVGKQTAGENVLTETKGFTDGSAIILSVAEIIPEVTADFSGGIKPDFVVDLTGTMSTTTSGLDASADTQLKKAFEVMETLKQ